MLTKTLAFSNSSNEYVYDGLTIIFDKTLIDEEGDLLLFLEIKNDNQKDYIIDSSAIIVNDGMVNENYHSDIIPSKDDVSDVIKISHSTLEAAGIVDVGKVEIYFNVYDVAGYTIIQEGILCAELSEYSLPVFSGHYLFNQKGIKIYGRYVDTTTIWGSSIQILCQNNTEREVYVSCERVRVNGVEVSSEYSELVLPSKHAVDIIRLASDAVNIDDITFTDEIELKLKIYDNVTRELICETNPIVFAAN